MDDIVTSLQSQQLQNYLNVGVAAVYFYEYALTLRLHIQCFWQRKTTPMAFILYLNCYVNCVVCIFTMIGLPGAIREASG